MTDYTPGRKPVDVDLTPAPSVEAGTLTALTATIANGAALSGAVAVPAGQVVRGIIVPSGWAAANLSFDVSHDDGVTYTSLRDPAGAEFYQAVAVSTFMPFPTVTGITHIKLRSGLLAAPVNQAAERALTVLVA